MNKKVYVVMDVVDFGDCADIEGRVSGEIFGIFESKKEAEKYMAQMDKKCQALPPEKRVCEFMILSFTLNKGIKKILTY